MAIKWKIKNPVKEKDYNYGYSIFTQLNRETPINPKHLKTLQDVFYLFEEFFCDTHNK